MKRKSALGPDGINWTGSEYALAEQRRVKQSRIERKRGKRTNKK